MERLLLTFEQKPLLTPDQWADLNRILPKTSAEPGPYRSTRTPYMIQPMRATVDPSVRRVTVVCGSQMGKTDSVMNVICQRLDSNNICPVLYVGPTRSNVEKIIEPRLMDAVKSSRRLTVAIERKQKMGKTAKRINGVLVRLAWAGSASELASQEVGLAILDELDRMDIDVEGEGSPIELVDARLATFIDGKMVLTSTPLEGNVVEEKLDTGLIHWKVAESESVTSKIWLMWQDGTRFEWAWPCPDCREYFIPRFSLVKWPEGSTPSQAEKQARLVCPCCGSLIEDAKKRWMNERGRFVAPGQRISTEGDVIGAVPNNDHHSFWVSGLCSPWRSFGYRARAYLRAVKSGDSDQVKTAVNTGLGELYRVGGDAPEWQEVKRAHAGGYSAGEIPAAVKWITAGVDVQKDRLVYAVRGWSYGLESWLLEFGELYGDPAYDEVWDRLYTGVISRDYNGLTLQRAVIDSGYKPGEESADHIVYTFARKYPAQVVAAKGHDSLDKPYYASHIDVRASGKVIKHGLQLWHVNSDFVKSFVHGRLRQKPDQPGAWHLPVDVSEDYCQQLVAEARVSKASGRATWIRLRKANHALDCEALNVAAIMMLGGHLQHRPASKAAPAGAAESVGQEPPRPEGGGAPPSVATSSPAPPASQPQQSVVSRWQSAPRSSNWATRWRK